MLHQIVLSLLHLLDQWGYLGIFVLMFLESTVFPIPSELVVPPAAMLAFQGRMDLSLVILCGVLGSLSGALFNYYAARYLGQPFLLKFGRWFFLPPKKLAKVETFFNKHGEIGTFTGRLIPVIRHLISIPAGLSSMKIGKFIALTTLGAGVWCSVLAGIGWKAGELYLTSSTRANEFFTQYGSRAGYASAAVCLIILIVYALIQMRIKVKKQSK